MSSAPQKKLNKMASYISPWANAPTVEDAIADGYMSASQTVVPQIQLRIKARRWAANLVMLVKLPSV